MTAYSQNYYQKYYEEFLKKDDRAKKIVDLLNQKAGKTGQKNILKVIREDPNLQSYQKELENRYYHFLEGKNN